MFIYFTVRLYRSGEEFMNNAFIAVILGYLADFLGVGIGALCTFLLCGIGKNRAFPKAAEEPIKKNLLLSLIFEFSSGLMMATVTFRLIPDSILKCGTLTALIGIFFGLLFVHFAKRLTGKIFPNANARLALLLSLCLHNIPEGFALGNAYPDILAMLVIFFAMAVHNIPQGFLLTFPSSKQKANKKFVFALTLLCGIPTAMGAFFGAFSAGASASFSGLMLSVAAGVTLYTLIFELSYEARRLCGRKIIETAYIIGLLFGTVIF